MGADLPLIQRPLAAISLRCVNRGRRKGRHLSVFADRKKCTMLVPGVVSFELTVARDGKSIVYAVPSQRLVTVYRQKVQTGKAVAQPQVAPKLPFAFPLTTGGNAYDFARDRSTVVYARPGG